MCVVFVYSLQVESLNFESWWNYKKCERDYKYDGRLGDWLCYVKEGAWKEDEKEGWDFWLGKVKVHVGARGKS